MQIFEGLFHNATNGKQSSVIQGTILMIIMVLDIGIILGGGY
jgi:hypothetical protein|tara:strand:- start:202 stop:327 length:126 start_codon:yes stop_codon:yes gene_type:complete